MAQAPARHMDQAAAACSRPARRGCGTLPREARDLRRPMAFILAATIGVNGAVREPRREAATRRRQLSRPQAAPRLALIVPAGIEPLPSAGPIGRALDHARRLGPASHDGLPRGAAACRSCPLVTAARRRVQLAVSGRAVRQPGRFR